MTAHLGLIPIRNFGVLTPGLYRSAQPMYGYEYDWLRKVPKIERVISLRKESRHDSHIAPEFGIEVINLDVIDHHPPELADVTRFIQALEDRKPTLFHCEHGWGRTSTFSVIAKVWLGMSVESAITHERIHFHYTFHHHSQEEFLRSPELLTTIREFKAAA